MAGPTRSEQTAGDGGVHSTNYEEVVRAFLGLTGYYRRFIPDFASVAVPLTNLTRKNVPNHVPWISKSSGS